MDNKIQYINKDYNSIKQSLIDFAKNYYPATYNDFNEASPGLMFIEMAAAVGDLLSFYQDTQIQEVFVQYAKERDNLYTLAYMFGFAPKASYGSQVDLDVYQIVPSIVSGSNVLPDYRYAYIINQQSIVSSATDTNLTFITQDPVDFTYSSSLDPTDVTIYSVDGANKPLTFLLKKKVKAVSGQIKTQTFTFGSPQRFPTAQLSDTNIIEIITVTDSDGNNWYEVPYLGQETVFDETRNTKQVSPYFSQFVDTTPYILNLKKAVRRYVTRLRSDNSLELQFGAGLSNVVDEVIVPNPDNVGLGLPNGISKLNAAYDPTNFLYTSTYGLAPSNTTLTINYLVGGGIESNVPSNTITKKININATPVNTINTGNTYLNSIAFNNPNPAYGGKGGDTIDEIRNKTLSSFAAQQRAVTKDDYIVRSLSMPTRYGTISKSYIIKDEQLNVIDRASLENNPLALNMYVLSYNGDKQLVPSTDGIKENLKTYLSQYRMLTDSINIKDAFIINLKVYFDITILPNYNSNEVLVRVIDTLKVYFNVDNTQINQPILISEVISNIANVRGVQSVVSVRFENVNGEDLGYSKYTYDIEKATLSNVLYPSLDPSIFEIKYPDNDIIGRVVNY
jgi:hypothetical protein